MKQAYLSASLFSMVLGLCGLGQGWRLAARLWGVSPVIGEAVLLLAFIVWAGLLVAYIVQACRKPQQVIQEFLHPVQGGAAALIGVSTLLIVLAVLPYSLRFAWVLAALGLSWHLLFSIWHTGTLWQGGRNPLDTVPSLYLPSVAGNFTSAGALGALGHADFGWLFLGAGVFSWVAIESLIIQRLWHGEALPVGQRALLGIQFAPPVVCATAWLLLAPGSTDHWLLMLWGYGLFQLLVGMRLQAWLGMQPFSNSYWSYTFGIASTTVCALKLALSGVDAAKILAIPIFAGANLVIGTLFLRTSFTAWQWLRSR
ncbi:dicarboxylate transporter/tellurite-resistance protein TehA [Undibacterium terreum]|uniref:Dicarboxylate transporter/tellurite-resistance protein TehA n=1 Tax=Undibacterium terreum TaxID=1224302 RepID=A0A916XAG2_9BURK|nr:dicarboxylate transporter/tellurite-resistance protein TehA [Undibacterium terreum]GGC57444.1 dicarboxylate transporter/tellurite-resistance protein TehA [Undibacterium terreum]